MANSPKKQLHAQRGLGRVAFLAAKEEIQTLLEAGWPMKSVYDYLGERMPIKISQFRHYIQVYIGNPHKNPPQSPSIARPADVSTPTSSAERLSSGTGFASKKSSAAEQRKPRAEGDPKHLPEDQEVIKQFEWKPRDPKDLM